MAKRVIIELSLVEESLQKKNKELETEIFIDLSRAGIVIPWCKTVERVTVRGT
jgi:hypothetical protein